MRFKFKPEFECTALAPTGAMPQDDLLRWAADVITHAGELVGAVSQEIGEPIYGPKVTWALLSLKGSLPRTGLLLQYAAETRGRDVCRKIVLAWPADPLAASFHGCTPGDTPSLFAELGETTETEQPSEPDESPEEEDEAGDAPQEQEAAPCEDSSEQPDTSSETDARPPDKEATL